MTQRELEIKKAELIEKIESWNIRGEDGEAMQSLIIKLLKGTDCTDPDFKKALEDNIAEEIISLNFDIYDLSEFVKWLSKHDFDLFIDYRFAETKSFDEAINDILQYGYEPTYCYDFDMEEFKQLDRIKQEDYIKDHFDGLIYSNETLLISW